MNKKVVLSIVSVAVAIVLLAAVALGMVGIYQLTREDPVEGAKEITVTVVHKDGSEKVFVCHTDEQYLGPVLVTEKIVADNVGEYGLYITTADGELADYNVDQGWWALYEGDTQCATGADQVVIEDGDSFRLVYTIGF